LVDAMGRLVGMNSRIADGSRMFVGIAYAITAEDLDRLVPLMIAEDLAPFPKLGLRARAVDRQVAAALGMGVGGLLIDAVETAGLAARMGLRAGDIILALNGVVIEAPGDLAFLIEAAQAGGTADLAILRRGQAVLVSLDLRPEDPAAGLLQRATAGTSAERKVSYRLESLGFDLIEGGVIDRILENSPAVWSGLAQGDRILAVNGESHDLRGLRGLEITAPALILVQGRDGQTRHVMLDPWGKSIGLRPVGGANVLDPAVVVF
jgi:serine protease Do